MTYKKNYKSNSLTANLISSALIVLRLANLAASFALIAMLRAISSNASANSTQYL